MPNEGFYSIDEWRGLSEEQRQLLIFQALKSISEMENRFASKRTENLVMAMFGIILVGFLTAVINNVLK